MRRLILIFAILFIACDSVKSTDMILAEVWSKDQDIRHRMVEVTKAVTVDGRTELIDSLIMLSEMVERVDLENMAVVDSVLQQGLPRGLSAESYKTIWIVIDHASLEKQEQYLPLIEQMSLDGLIGRDEYAILFDRVAMKQNRKQRYGSQSIQFGKNQDVQLYIWPVENPAAIDSLRASVGLSPLVEYLTNLKETTGFEAVYDPTITVEKINKMRNGT